MIMQIYVMIQNAAKLGFPRKIDLKNGMKLIEKIIGVKLPQQLMKQKVK